MHRMAPLSWPAQLQRVLLLAAAAALAAAPPVLGAAPAPCPAGGAPPRPARVLAVGDSLTKGAVPSLSINHPYTQRLGQLLGAELRAPPQITAAAVGSAGTLVPGPGPDGRPMLIPQLLDTALSEARAAQGGAQGGAGAAPYDVIILMAGINDLGRGNKSADDVMAQIRGMASKAGGAATTAVVVVLPWANRFVARGSDNEAQRLRLTSLLQQWAAATPRLGGPGGPRLLLDEAAKGPLRFWDMPKAQRSRLQDDELHLTKEGYDLLGGHLFGTLLNGGVVAALRCSDAGGPSQAAAAAPGGDGGEASAEAQALGQQAAASAAAPPEEVPPEAAAQAAAELAAAAAAAAPAAAAAGSARAGGAPLAVAVVAAAAMAAALLPL
ncbi:MAG: hypothetical protein J3K34DRAFT_523682 [Monoraphidium minutum]|nr:MAG: hypothetical protein J3K34DRAFT_523682 [Monoraphidium minutum]